MVCWERWATTPNPYNDHLIKGVFSIIIIIGTSVNNVFMPKYIIWIDLFFGKFVCPSVTKALTIFKFSIRNTLNCTAAEDRRRLNGLFKVDDTLRVSLQEGGQRKRWTRFPASFISSFKKKKWKSQHYTKYSRSFRRPPSLDDSNLSYWQLHWLYTKFCKWKKNRFR